MRPPIEDIAILKTIVFKLFMKLEVNVSVQNKYAYLQFNAINPAVVMIAAQNEELEAEMRFSRVYLYSIAKWKNT